MITACFQSKKVSQTERAVFVICHVDVAEKF